MIDLHVHLRTLVVLLGTLRTHIVRPRDQRGAVELTSMLLLAGGVAAAALVVVEILTGKVTELASSVPTR
ncbi:hypothetical protein [Nocardioides zeae]